MNEIKTLINKLIIKNNQNLKQIPNFLENDLVCYFAKYIGDNNFEKLENGQNIGFVIDAYSTNNITFIPVINSICVILEVKGFAYLISCYDVEEIIINETNDSSIMLMTSTFYTARMEGLPILDQIYNSVHQLEQKAQSHLHLLTTPGGSPSGVNSTQISPLTTSDNLKNNQIEIK